MQIAIIAAVDKSLGIGLEGKLLAQIPEDMKLFKTLTLNNVLIMGRKTFESLPSRKALKDRINIVLSDNKSFLAEEIHVFNSMNKALEFAKSFDKDIFFIGGASIYEMALDIADFAYITEIDRDFGADTFFPDIHNRSDWQLVSKSEEMKYGDISYFFCKYMRKSEEHSI